MAEIEFGTFKPEQKQNPYDETITKLIEAGEDAAVTLTVDAVDEKRERLAFSKAANAQDKTARLRVRDDSKAKYDEDEDGKQTPKSGVVKLTFTLTKRHAPRRGKDEVSEGETSE